MKLTKAGSVVIITSLLFGLNGLCQAKSKSIVQHMRDSGFKHKTASWTAKSTQKDEKGKVSKTESKIWISGDKYRMESKEQQSGKKTVFIDDGKVKYIYTPGEKKAMKLGTGMESMFGQMLSSDIFAESARNRKNAKPAGKGKVDGKKCTIFTYKSEITIMSNKISNDVKEWVWIKEDFPLKSIVKTPKQKMSMGMVTTEIPASETTTVIKKLAFNKTIAGNMFKLPKGTKIEEGNVPAGRGPSTKSLHEKKPPKKSREEMPAEVMDMMKNLF